MKIVYSFNKRGFEAEYWTREIARASSLTVEFIPFNHDRYLRPSLYARAQLLDNLYFARDHRLLRLYDDFEKVLSASRADAVIVDNCFPYHPDYLRRLSMYRVLRTTDGPIAAYDRDFAYVHAYDHVLYHSPAYSRDMGMAEKLRYCGARRSDFWPLALFETNYDSMRTEDELMSQERDIDVIFIGAMHLNKMPFLAKLKKALGPRLRMHGLGGFKRNIYFNVRYGLPGWVRPVPFAQYVPLYQRAKIGINVHNRGDFSVGNYRLFDLAGNGVMQISDGGEYLNRFFDVGSEIERYASVDELIDKIRYFLSHDHERKWIARKAYRRVLRDYTIREQLHRAAALIENGMRSFKEEEGQGTDFPPRKTYPR